MAEFVILDTEYLLHAGFSKWFALPLSLLTTALAISLVINVKIGLLNVLIRFTMLVIDLRLAPIFFERILNLGQA